MTHINPAPQWTCLHCDATLELENDLLVDTLSGDLGGTYDYCPVNPSHQHQAAAR